MIQIVKSNAEEKRLLAGERVRTRHTDTKAEEQAMTADRERAHTRSKHERGRE